MVETATRVRRFTRKEYERMGAQGILGPEERVELLDGEILVMSPHGTRHATVLRLLTKALERIFDEDHDVRTQLPLALGDMSEPEPDIAVVTGSPGDYRHEHPGTAVLVVEVSDTTLATDLGKKAAVYARAGLPKYWVVDLVHEVVEVHREPRPASGSGWAYEVVKRVKVRGSVSPLAAPKARIRVASFLV